MGICTVARADSLVFGKVFFRHEISFPGLLKPHPPVSLCVYPLGSYVLGCDAVFAKQPPKMVGGDRLSPFGPGSPGALFVLDKLLDQGCSRDFIEAGSLKYSLDVGQQLDLD